MNHPFRRSLAVLCALGLLCSLMAAWPQSARAEVITFRFTLDPAVHGESVHINVAVQSDTDPAAGGGFSRFTITISRRGTVLVNSNYKEQNDRVIMGVAMSIGTLRYTNDQPQDQALDFVCKVYRRDSLVGESTHNGYVPCIIHQFTRTTTQQSCTTAEAVIDTCDICGFVERTETAPPLGHDIVYQHVAGSTGRESRHLKICRRDSSHNLEEDCPLQVVGSYPPGCTTPGQRLLQCHACQYGFAETLEALGHDWAFFRSNQDGSHSMVCRRDISHVEQSAPCQYDITASPPTCETAGVTSRVCQLCQYAPPDSITAPLGHDWSPWTSGLNGSHSRSCQRDDDHVEVQPCAYSPALLLPSCTEPGHTRHTCGLCGHSYTDEPVPALGHDWTDWTSQDDGSHSRVCRRDASHTEAGPCGYQLSTTHPFCTTAGFTIHTCAVCGHAYTDAHTEPLGHDWAAWASQEDGTHRRACLRDSSHTDTKPCEYADAIIPPTCTEAGFTTHTCAVCGYAHVDTRTDPLGHDWTEWASQDDGTHRRSCLRDSSHTDTKPCEYALAITPPTCTEAGFTTHTCAVCGHAYIDTRTDPLGHDWTEWASQGDGTHRRSCLRDSSHADTKPCEYAVAITPPTCTEAGFTTHTCAVCGYAHVDTRTDPLGHNWAEWASQEDGTHNRSCLRDSSHTDTKPCEYALAITPPTCTEAGFTTHTCAVCGYAHTDAHTAPLGHRPGDWVISQAPSGRASGLETRHCLACGLLLATNILPRLRSMRFQNTACIGGPRFRDSLPELTSLWYSYALVDLQQEGRTSYPLIASNRSCIGRVYLDIREGHLMVSYQVFLHRWHLREEYFNFFPSLAAVRSEDLEHLSPDSYAFGQPIPLSNLPRESGQSLLFLRLLLDYDAFDEGLAAGF